MSHCSGDVYGYFISLVETCQCCPVVWVAHGVGQATNTGERKINDAWERLRWGWTVLTLPRDCTCSSSHRWLRLSLNAVQTALTATPTEWWNNWWLCHQAEFKIFFCHFVMAEMSGQWHRAIQYRLIDVTNMVLIPSEARCSFWLQALFKLYKLPFTVRTDGGINMLMVDTDARAVIVLAF